MALTRGNGSIDGIMTTRALLETIRPDLNTRLELITGERYKVSATDEGNGIPLANGRFANPVFNTLISTPKTGGGVLEISKLNDIQDGSTTYTLPKASTTDIDEYMIVSQSLEFSASKPVVTVFAGDTITIEGGTDTSIIFDQSSSKDIRLNSDGVSNWKLTV